MKFVTPKGVVGFDVLFWVAFEFFCFGGIFVQKFWVKLVTLKEVVDCIT